MKRVPFTLMVAGAALVGCSEPPTQREFLRQDAECLRCYCRSNAYAAENALHNLDRYLHRCERARVRGILYDEVFARTYARLYLVDDHLGKSEAAEAYLRKALEHYRESGHSFGQLHASEQAVRRRLVDEFDGNLAVAWPVP